MKEIATSKHFDYHEHELSILVDNAPDMILRYDRCCRLTYANAQLEVALGVSVKNVLGKTHKQTATDGRYEVYEAAIRRVISSGKDAESYLTVLDNYGAETNHHMRMTPEMDDSGKVVNVFVIGRDITEHRRMDETLLAKEQEFRSLAENLPDNIARWDLEGRYIYVNSVHQRSLASTANLIGKTSSEAFPDGRFAPVTSAIAQVIATGQPVLSVRLPVSFENGETQIHDVSLVPERDAAGNVISVLGIGRDITELCRLQEDLKSKEQLLRALANSSPGMMCAFYARHDGSICMPYVSPNIEKLFGLLPQDVTNDASSLLALNHPDDAQRVTDSIAESARNMNTWHEEYRILHPTRGELWMESNTHPLPHPDGGVIWYGYIHDITKRKRVESELLTHMNFQQTLLTAINEVGMQVMMIENGRIIHVGNRELAHQFGYTDAELDAHPPLLDIIHPDDREMVMNNYISRIKGEPAPNSYELGLMSKDGKRHEFDTCVALIPNTDPVRVITIGKDISERKVAGAQLALLNYALDHVKEEVFLVDENSDLKYVNGAACRGRMYDREELLKLNIAALDPNYSLTRWPDHWRELKENGSLHFETLHTRKDGQTFPVEIIANYFAFDGKEYNLSLVHDITERKRAEDALRESQEKLSDLFKLSSLGIALTDMQGRYFEFNEAFRAICGYPSEELLMLDYWTLTPREYEAKEGEQLESLARTGRYGPYEKEYRQKDGTLIPVQLNGTLITGKDGHQYIWSIVEDITERKRSEDVLKFIAQGEWLNSDVEFLTSLASYLGRLLGMDYVIIDKLGSDPAYAETVAIYAKGAVVPNMQYSLQYTPCENVMNGGLCCYPENIQQQFPKDILLVDMQVESYAGIPLWDSKGNVIGLIALMDGKPMIDTNSLTSVLQQVATSAAIALERQQADAKLKEKFERIAELNNQLEINARDLEDQAAEFEAQAVELEASQEQIMQTEAWYRNIVRSVPDGMAVVSESGNIVLVNFNIEKMFGYEEGELIGHPIEILLPPDARQGHVAKRDGFFASEVKGRPMEDVVFGLRACRKDGSEFPVYVSLSRLPDMDGRAGVICAAIRDITEHKRLEDALAAREYESRTLVDNSPDNISRYDRGCRRIFVNPACAAAVDGGVAALLGKTPTECPGGPNAELYETKIRETFETGLNCEFELIWANKEGREVCSHVRITAESDGAGNVMSVLTVGRDITELNEHRKQVHQMAFYDSLTSLPNRALFNDRLRQMITDASWHGQQAGVMLLDLDRFKAVNDTLGHPAGDELLREAAARLTYCVRGYDTVARLGGDEFAILLTEIRSADDLGRVANKIVETFKEPFLLEGKEVFVTTSIGIAVYPADSENSDDLLKMADSAMYFAKRSGRNTFRFYSKDLSDLSNERLLLEGDLRRGFARGELELYYQPKVRLADGMLIGSEALLRWNHPKRGIVAPDKFISIAEESGLIIDIGAWVLRDACRVANGWNGHGKPLHKVAINLSARQFQSNDLVKTVRNALEDTHCYPEWIELEITESLLLDDGGEVLEALESFRAIGITIAIDDFGTGYSSLSYLARFPVDTLKIDRLFISRITEGGHYLELVKAIILIANSLKQNVVAEGVETVEQAAVLQKFGCDIAQGYLYSRPIPKAMFDTLPRSFEMVQRSFATDSMRIS
jgi:diguanylate cyclase (GGDEF)-like protein/PAS domain S-box-containing protein